MNPNAKASNSGTVVDIRFERNLPPLYSVLQVGKSQAIVSEVLARAVPAQGASKAAGRD